MYFIFVPYSHGTLEQEIIVYELVDHSLSVKEKAKVLDTDLEKKLLEYKQSYNTNLLKILNNSSLAEQLQKKYGFKNKGDI